MIQQRIKTTVLLLRLCLNPPLCVEQGQVSRKMTLLPVTTGNTANIAISSALARSVMLSYTLTNPLNNH